MMEEFKEESLKLLSLIHGPGNSLPIVGRLRKAVQSMPKFDRLDLKSRNSSATN